MSRERARVLVFQTMSETHMVFLMMLMLMLLLSSSSCCCCCCDTGAGMPGVWSQTTPALCHQILQRYRHSPLSWQGLWRRLATACLRYCVCVCVRAHVCVCVCVCVYMWEREREIECGVKIHQHCATRYFSNTDSQDGQYNHPCMFIYSRDTV